MSHFDVLKSAIEQHDGALIKTIGDAVMAVFKRPADAFHAMLVAQSRLASPTDNSRPLELKAGLHFGPCIAVSLNERLDYFGTTVNFASRLVELSSGRNLIISHDFHEDPEVAVLLEDEKFRGRVVRLQTKSLKGFEDEEISLWQVETGS
jgi:class 3 adenylate cyclase